MSRRLRLDLAYDGTEFAGWQVQPGQRTVQGVLESILARLQGDRPVRLRGAGRTDAGVHARGQVADCRLDVEGPDERLAYRLRRMAPMDLRPVQVRTVDESFHSRHDAVRKEYRYRLDLTPHGDPLELRYALHVQAPLDVVALDRALAALRGRHDWSGFAASGCTVADRVREMVVARWESTDPGRACFVFQADGFLQYMVRNLVGTLLEIGRGRMDPGQVPRILDLGDRNLAGPTAPARGLVLTRVIYAGEDAGMLAGP